MGAYLLLFLLTRNAAFWASLQFLTYLASLTWWWCQGLGGHATICSRNDYICVMCLFFHFNHWCVLQPEIWNNLCLNASLLWAVSPGNPSLSGVPLLGRGTALVPRVGTEHRVGQEALPTFPPRSAHPADGLQVTSVGSVCGATPRRWDFWLLLSDFYSLMRFFEVNVWIKFLVLCVAQNYREI